MAKEKEEKKPEGKHEEGGEKKNGAKKKHLHQIIHTFSEPDKDGKSHVMHEHVHKDHANSPHTHPPRFMGTSQNMEDLMQHDQDHAGPMMEGGGEEGGEGEEDGGEGEAPAAPAQE